MRIRRQASRPAKHTTLCTPTSVIVSSKRAGERSSRAPFCYVYTLDPRSCAQAQFHDVYAESDTFSGSSQVSSLGYLQVGVIPSGQRIGRVLGADPTRIQTHGVTGFECLTCCERRVCRVLNRANQLATTGAIDGTVDEGKLVKAAQRDPAEFGPLYELYVDRIYRYAYRRVGTHHDAEDVTAQTFQQALAALPKYEWRGLPFGAWLFRIAANIINRRGRTGSREIAVEDVTVFSIYEDVADDPVDQITHDEMAIELQELVETLPPDQQRALVLKFSHGLKNREIGELMGRSEGAVKQLVHRALVNLRTRITLPDATPSIEQSPAGD